MMFGEKDDSGLKHGLAMGETLLIQIGSSDSANGKSRM